MNLKYLDVGCSTVGRGITGEMWGHGELEQGNLRDYCQVMNSECLYVRVPGKELQGMWGIWTGEFSGLL